MTEAALTAQDFILFAPALSLVILGFGVLLIGLLLPRIYRETFAALVFIGFAASVFFTLQNWSEETTTIFHNMIWVDRYASGFFAYSSLLPD